MIVSIVPLISAMEEYADFLDGSPGLISVTGPNAFCFDAVCDRAPYTAADVL